MNAKTRMLTVFVSAVLAASSLVIGRAAAADTTGPVLSWFTIDSQTVYPGLTATFRYVVSDDSAGVSSVAFRLTDTTGVERTATGTASGTATLTTQGTWPAGLYRLDAIDVSDGVGNTTTYLVGGAVHRSAQSTGPSTHPFNLDSGSFTLVGGQPAPQKPAIRGILDRDGQPDAVWQPAVNGYVIKVGWRELQAIQAGEITDGNPIDHALTSVRQVNATRGPNEPKLSLKLRIFTGDESPEWAKNLDGPPFYVEDPADGSPITIGRFWTSNFDAAYRDLHTKLAARYDGVPEIRDVVVARCMLGSAEPYLRQPSSSMTTNNLRYAGFTTAADQACHRAEVDAHKVWSRTTSSVAFNPYTQINADGSTKVNGAWTDQMIDYCRSSLGTRCVLENNSIRDGSQGANYPAMYTKIKAKGAPIAFQTAAPSRIGSLCNTTAWAIGQGAGAVEVPDNYTKDPGVTLAGLRAYDVALEGTAPPAPATPSGARVTRPSSTSASITWNAASGAACYRVVRDGVTLGTTMATTYVDPQSYTGVAYAYSVVALNAAGAESAPATATDGSTPPPTTSTTSTTSTSTTSTSTTSTSTTSTTRPPTTTTSTSTTTSTTRPPTTTTSTTVVNTTTTRPPPTTTTTTRPASTDTSAPSVPTGFYTTHVMSTSVGLKWSPSTDNVGVTGYQVLRNGVVIATVTGTSYTDTTVQPRTMYEYRIRAKDAAGNLSGASYGLSVYPY